LSYKEKEWGAKDRRVWLGPGFGLRCGADLGQQLGRCHDR
jgi:hypothetical protein